MEYPFCHDVGKYEKLMKVGQGTFGEVFKARDRNSKRLVALKKILMENEKEGFPITALREVKILRLLNHENIVNLIEVCRAKTSPNNKLRVTFYLVFEFCEHDLAGLLASVRFTLPEIKKIMQMLLNALYFLHFNNILHRDMKTSNILMSKSGVLKLTDFGLARAVHVAKDVKYTNRVVTLWYRPPELLLGERIYGPPIDMWGAGCIMAEMWTRAPIMQGGTEQMQLNLISKLCGSIDTNVWHNVDKTEYWSRMDLPKGLKRCLRDKIRAYVKDAHGIDLVDHLLTLDPAKRMDADTALNHDFFWSDPMPCDLAPTLARVHTSMFELHTVRRGKPAAAAAHNNAQRQHKRAEQISTAIYDRIF